MTRNWKIFIAVLAVGVVIGLISLRSLHRRMKRLAQTEVTEEQARHDLLAPPVSTPTDVPVKASIFWAGGPDSLAPVEIELPLSADPAQRSRQLLQRPDCRTAYAGPAHASRGRRNARLLHSSRRHRDRGLLRCALDGNPVGNLEREDGGRFDCEDPCEQCDGIASAKNFDSWAGSRYACRAYRSHRVFRFEFARSSNLSRPRRRLRRASSPNAAPPKASTGNPFRLRTRGCEASALTNRWMARLGQTRRTAGRDSSLGQHFFLRPNLHSRTGDVSPRTLSACCAQDVCPLP